MDLKGLCTIQSVYTISVIESRISLLLCDIGLPNVLDYSWHVCPRQFRASLNVRRIKKPSCTFLKADYIKAEVTDKFFYSVQLRVKMVSVPT